MQWTEKLSIGVEKIDTQHKELFKKINNLVEAIKEHRCKDEIDATIKFLEDYARIHFAAEEKYMKESHYSGYDEHKAHHAAYLASLSELKKEAALPRVHGSSYDLSVTANQMVVDWIIDHIMKVDSKFGEHLKSRHGKRENPV